MEFKPEIVNEWLDFINTALPDLIPIISKADGTSLVLGAAVMGIYGMHGWLIRERATGDLDLSVGVIADPAEYRTIRDALLQAGYVARKAEKYRLYSPKQASGYAYVDLLAHPQGEVSRTAILHAMEVGPGWSFGAIKFALLEAFSLTSKLVVPNPLGFLALKADSYQDNPKRVRDLVDIVDLVNSLVSKGLHYDLAELWTAMRVGDPVGASQLRNAIRGFVDEATAWSLLPAKIEFEKRHFVFDEIDEKAKDVFHELLEQMSP